MDGIYVDVEAADNSGKAHTTLRKECMFNCEPENGRTAVSNGCLSDQRCDPRNERPPVRFGGHEGHRQGPGGGEMLQTLRPPPGADDGDAGVPPAHGQLPSHHGKSLESRPPRR